MARLGNFTIKTKLLGIVACTVLGMASILAMAMFVITNYRVNGPLYQRLFLRKSAMAEIEPCTLFVIEPFMTLSQMNSSEDARERKALLATFDAQEQEYLEREKYWAEHLFEGPVRRGLIEKINPSVQRLFRAARQEFFPVLIQGDRQQMTEVFRSAIQPAFDEHRRMVDETIKAGREMTEREQDMATREVTFWTTAMVIVSVAVAVLIAGLAFFVANGVNRASQALISRVNEMASGASDLTARVTTAANDEFGQLAVGINAMIAKIHSIVSRSATIQLAVAGHGFPNCGHCRPARTDHARIGKFYHGNCGRGTRDLGHREGTRRYDGRCESAGQSYGQPGRRRTVAN